MAVYDSLHDFHADILSHRWESEIQSSLNRMENLVSLHEKIGILESNWLQFTELSPLKWDYLLAAARKIKKQKNVRMKKRSGVTKQAARFGCIHITANDTDQIHNTQKPSL